MSNKQKIQRYNPQMPSMNYDHDDFTAFRNAPFMGPLARNPESRFDSAEDASVFFARELDWIKSQTYDVLYPEFTALSLFAVSSEVNVGAESVTYYGYDKTGMAKIIHNYATDLPRADVYGEPTTCPIKSLGTSYGYSNQEMRASRMSGKSLDVRKGDSAKYAIDYLTNKIAWAGHPESGVQGVLTPENDVPMFALETNAAGTSTRFVDKSPQEKLRDVAAMIKFVASLTKSVERPDTLALPTDAFLDLFDTPRSDASDVSVGQWILNNTPRLKAIVEAPELNADSGITPYPGIGVGFMFKKDPKKFTIEIPMPFYQYPIQLRNLEFAVPCESRVAGAIMYYPLSCLIIPGV